MGNPAVGTYNYCGGINYLTSLVLDHNDGLVLSYNLAQGGSTILPTVVSSKVGLTFQEQMEQEFLPNYGGGDKTVQWTAQDSIFSVFIGINE